MSQNVIQQLQELGQAVKEAKADMEEKQAEVKKHHNEIYAPMCRAKKDAEARYERLRDQLKSLARENAELLESLKGI